MYSKNQFIPVIFVVLLTFTIGLTSMAQGSRMDRKCTISWNPPQAINVNGSNSFAVLSFSGSALRPEFGMLPVFTQSFPFDPNYDSVDHVTLLDQVFEQFNEQELAQVRGLDKISADIVLCQELSVTKKIPSLLVSLLPLRRNPATGSIERLVSFTIELEIVKHTSIPVTKSADTYAPLSLIHI